ncbi:LOW QUALITY PROTEIN: histamine H3 receptor-like [Lethenteron reissneri]|uniref:LOW QUALITY PROTEIN: histamine H3 receptor-like n=1 Tax=Lethenteron reissneri TaxID=7753 RepID=UPI002AB5F6CD|nr:LOW QUALITY PROTEIN: histamine H3 receptor-like [Lethenteron reissneri]
MRNGSPDAGPPSWPWPPDSGGLPKESGGSPGSAASQVHVAGGRGMALLWPPGSSWTPGQEALLTALMVVLMLATVVGNAFVILAFAVDRGLRTHANFFFLNLAIADLLVGGFCIPLYVPYVLTGEWRLGRGLCKLWLVMDYLLCTASVFNIVLISFDRFLSVTRAVSYRAQQCMPRRAVLKMLAVWLAAFLLYGPAIIAWEHVAGRSVVPQGECYAEFYYNWYFLIVASTFEFFTPLLSVAYFNLMIYSNIRRRRRTRRDPTVATRQQHPPPPPPPPPPRPGVPAAIGRTRASPAVPESTPARCFSSKKVPRIRESRGRRRRIPPRASGTRGAVAARVHVAPRGRPRCPRSRENGRRRAPLLVRSVEVDVSLSLAQTRRTICARRGEATSSAAASVASSAAGRVARLGTPRANVVGLCVNREPLSGLQGLEEKDRGLVPGGDFPGLCAEQRRYGATRPRLPHSADASVRLSRDKRVAKSLAIIVCVFAMCWAPYTLLMIIRAACRSRCVDDRLYEFSFWLLWLNSAVNPVLYPLCHVRFKRAFLRILCQRKFKVEPQVVARMRCRVG